MDFTAEAETVVIAGDVTIDWNLIFFQGTQDATALWSASNTARICPQLGGVSMLSRLIETTCKGLVGSFGYLKVTESDLHPGDERYNHSYAIWGLLGEKETKAWRVSQYLGIDPARGSGNSLIAEDDPEQADLVVLDDANLGFRNHPELWPRALNNTAARPWIILKLSYPAVNGKLLTVDRTEIESYRTIGALIQEYINQEKADKPVSIAVFGAPGSGKSFGIKEIANSLSDRIKEITFNLSQMNSPADLVGALHQVRDESLRGKIPLVFWDEFDTSLEGTPLGWLRYFLAPMQDGSFLEGQVTHPIGRAIFVFAGGTCDRMEDFGMKLDDDAAKNAKLFKAVKGPDFRSRLKGFINILGPNPLKGAYDPYFIIRRAILLHSLMRRLVPQIYSPALQMDDNLLDAFLETQIYLHGVRSMESIVAMSQLSGKSRFERSCLPPISQLDLHVIGWEFMARVQKLKFEGEALDKLARAVHTDFVEFMKACGYIYGPKIDDKANPPTHNALVEYDQLEEGDCIQNVQNALSIPAKLARSGYVMIHARTNEPPLVFPDKDLDLLAEEEHRRWVKAKIVQDSHWHYAPKTDKANYAHNGLLPWSKASEEELAQVFSAEERAVMGRDALPEAEKKKDRQLIQRIPYILARVGYTVIKLGDSD